MDISIFAYYLIYEIYKETIIYQYNFFEHSNVIHVFVEVRRNQITTNRDGCRYLY